jgi:hypothetical protein
VLAPPTAGTVGSLLGLKPYSSISLRRSSSAFFLDFRFLQNQSPAITKSATATIGTTTAIAIFPPSPSFPLPPVPSFADCRAAAALEEAAAAAESLAEFAAGLSVGVERLTLVDVSVTTTVEPPAVCFVTTEVIVVEAAVALNDVLDSPSAFVSLVSDVMLLVGGVFEGDVGAEVVTLSMNELDDDDDGVVGTTSEDVDEVVAASDGEDVIGRLVSDVVGGVDVTKGELVEFVNLEFMSGDDVYLCHCQRKP